CDTSSGGADRRAGSRRFPCPNRAYDPHYHGMTWPPRKGMGDRLLTLIASRAAEMGIRSARSSPRFRPHASNEADDLAHAPVDRIGDGMRPLSAARQHLVNIAPILIEHALHFASHGRKFRDG